MRKTIKIVTVLFFILLAIVAFNLPTVLLNFLLVGAIPGTSLSVPPLAMLVLQLITIIFVSLEILARRSTHFFQIRVFVFGFVIRNVRLAFRVFRRA